MKACAPKTMNTGTATHALVVSANAGCVSVSSIQPGPSASGPTSATEA